MYDFNYSFIKKHFDAELVFTETDSLTHEIKLEDVYKNFFKHKHLFYFSKYFTLVSIRKIQSFLIRPIKLLVK